MGLLLATLALKVGWARELPGADPGPFAARAETLLRANGFATRRRPHPTGIFVYGARPGCRIMIGDYEPGGENANLIAIFARPIGPLAYAWRGTLAPAAPRLWPLTDYLIGRQLRHFGLAPARHPVAAIAASAGCDLTRIDWAAFGSL